MRIPFRLVLPLNVVEPSYLAVHADLLPAMALSNVVFPEPLPPIIAVRLPWGILALIFLNSAGGCGLLSSSRLPI